MEEKSKSDKVVEIGCGVVVVVILSLFYFWLMGKVWDVSENGMVEATLEKINYQPEKASFDFPEIKIFEGRIFQESEVSKTPGGAWPPYSQKISLAEFSKLDRGEPFAIASHSFADSKLELSLIGNSFDSTVRYYCVFSKEIDVPIGKKVINVKYTDGKVEVLQQVHGGIFSWKLFWERLFTHTIWIAALIFCLIQWHSNSKSYRKNIEKEQKSAEKWEGRYFEQLKRAKDLQAELTLARKPVSEDTENQIKDSSTSSS